VWFRGRLPRWCYPGWLHRVLGIRSHFIPHDDYQKCCLDLNNSKCEIIGFEVSARQTWSTTHLDFHEPFPQETVFLGSQLFDPGIYISLHRHSLSLKRMCKRQLLLSFHEAFFILKSSLTMLKWPYFLRTSACFNSEKLAMIDNIQRDSLSSTPYVLLLYNSWSQASLPVRWSGLGVRSLVDLAPTPFFSFIALSDIYFQPFFSSLLSRVLQPQRIMHTGHG